MNQRKPLLNNDDDKRRKRLGLFFWLLVCACCCCCALGLLIALIVALNTSSDMYGSCCIQHSSASSEQRAACIDNITASTCNTLAQDPLVESVLYFGSSDALNSSSGVNSCAQAHAESSDLCSAAHSATQCCQFSNAGAPSLFPSAPVMHCSVYIDETVCAAMNGTVLDYGVCTGSGECIDGPPAPNGVCCIHHSTTDESLCIDETSQLECDMLAENVVVDALFTPSIMCDEQLPEVCSTTSDGPGCCEFSFQSSDTCVTGFSDELTCTDAGGLFWAEHSCVDSKCVPPTPCDEAIRVECDTSYMSSTYQELPESYITVCNSQIGDSQLCESTQADFPPPSQDYRHVRWFRFDYVDDGDLVQLEFTTCNTDTVFDSNIVVIEGDCQATNTSCVACNDFTNTNACIGNYWSAHTVVNVYERSAQVFRIGVHGYKQEDEYTEPTGAFRLDVICKRQSDEPGTVGACCSGTTCTETNADTCYDVILESWFGEGSTCNNNLCI